MSKILYIGFKGQNNSSGALVKSLPGQSVLLTNSFPGLKKDIDGLPAEYSIATYRGDTNSFELETRIM